MAGTDPEVIVECPQRLCLALSGQWTSAAIHTTVSLSASRSGFQLFRAPPAWVRWNIVRPWSFLFTCFFSYDAQLSLCYSSVMSLLFLLSRIESIAKTQRIHIGITECKGTTFMVDMQYLSHDSWFYFPTFLRLSWLLRLPLMLMYAHSSKKRVYYINIIYNINIITYIHLLLHKLRRGK